MQENDLESVLAELRGKFELVLEDYAALYAEVQRLRCEAREQHEMTIFLLRAVASDLNAHCTDRVVHSGAQVKAQGRVSTRTVHLSPYRPPL